LGPGHLAELLRRDQLSRGAVDDIEEAVLWCVQDDLAWLAIDGNRGQHQVHCGGEVPALAGRGLVVPDIVSGVGIERDDRAQEQIVSASGAANLLIPWT